MAENFREIAQNDMNGNFHDKNSAITTFCHNCSSTVRWTTVTPKSKPTEMLLAALQFSSPILVQVHALCARIHAALATCAA